MWYVYIVQLYTPYFITLFIFNFDIYIFAFNLPFVWHPIADLFLSWGVVKHSFNHSFNQGGVRCSSMVRAFVHGAMVHRIDPSWWTRAIHDWCNKGCCMCYPVCGMMHIKETLLLIRTSSPCSGSSGFSLSLSEWSFTICLMPYNRK